jgi:arylsulfatase A-like enzyme
MIFNRPISHTGNLRRLVLASILAGALSGFAAAPPQNPLLAKVRPDKRPSIILIVADDLGYGDLGCYGQTKIKTPNLDQLAAEGLRFTQFYAGSSVCAPSRATLLTGRHTGHASIRRNADLPLRPEDLTVAESLKTGGYRTCAVGKWGLGLENSTGTPNRKGFDEWLGCLGQFQAEDPYPTQLYRNELVLPLDKNLYGNHGQYSHDLFSMVASNFVRVSKPFSFFLYLAYTLPHVHNGPPDQNPAVPGDAQSATEDWPPAEKCKAAMITRLDRDIGSLVQQLKSLKSEDDTVIFFTSDNGPHQDGGVNPAFFHSAGPLRGLKGDFYEGGIRVPMIARWPGRIRAGTVSDQVWAFWDFLPMAAEIAGVKVSAGIDGVSFLPTLLGQSQTNHHDFLYWESHERGSQQAVRMGDWKAVRLGPGQPLELYDLQLDLGETTNVANQHPEVVAKIEAYLKTARAASAEWPLLTAREAAKSEASEGK